MEGSLLPRRVQVAGWLWIAHSVVLASAQAYAFASGWNRIVTQRAVYVPLVAFLAVSLADLVIGAGLLRRLPWSRLASIVLSALLLLPLAPALWVLLQVRSPIGLSLPGMALLTGTVLIALTSWLLTGTTYSSSGW
jgi:hypothetical protein